MNKLQTFLLLVFFTTPIFALTVSKSLIESELAGAEAVATFTVTSFQNFSHPEFFAMWKVTAEVDTVEWVSPDASFSLSVGETITVEGIGGEVGNVGMNLSGYPIARNNGSYRAYLREKSAGLFEIVGLTKGLIDLAPRREYTRNRTNGSDGAGDGPFLYWDPKYFPISYFISLPTFMSLPNFISAIDESFKTWRDISGSRVDFIAMGCTNNVRNENDGINSVILVTSDWAFNSSVIAITRNFYIAGNSAGAGLIFDSDILMNGVNHQFTTSNEAGKYDVQNIITHEVGHVLGLGHDTDDTEATMDADATPNEIKKRTLDTNDIEGVLAGYAGVSQKLGNQSISCQSNDGSAGCAAVHGDRRNIAAWLAGCVYLLLILPFVTRRFLI